MVPLKMKEIYRVWNPSLWLEAQYKTPELLLAILKKLWEVYSGISDLQLSIKLKINTYQKEVIPEWDASCHLKLQVSLVE